MSTRIKPVPLDTVTPELWNIVEDIYLNGYHAGCKDQLWFDAYAEAIKLIMDGYKFDGELVGKMYARLKMEQ